MAEYNSNSGFFNSFGYSGYNNPNEPSFVFYNILNDNTEMHKALYRKATENIQSYVSEGNFKSRRKESADKLFAMAKAELAKEQNIPFVIHAGEASGANSVKTALEMGASRIGHGIHSIDDEKVIQMLVEKQIPLEICPKSNLDTKTISSFEQLPIKKFMEKGIKVTLNTDDMAVSNTTLENEYNILSNIGFSYEQLKQISLNTIDAAFLSEKEKEELKSYLK